MQIRLILIEKYKVMDVCLELLLLIEIYPIVKNGFKEGIMGFIVMDAQIK